MSDYSPTPGPLTFVQYLRNIAFYLHIALATILIGLWGLFKVATGGREGAIRVSTVWIGHVVWSARIYLGLIAEVRGTPPTHDCIVAAKHQSFWDIMAISHAVPRRAFIMKREVMRVPIMGWYAYKVGCIPIDRSRGKDAMTAISERVSERIAERSLGQLIIYPEGTRTLPGQRKAYKHGVASIRAATGLDVVPVAVNTGLFWPRKGWGIRPGRAVVEFLPVIPPGTDSATFMADLERQIEGNSDRLMAEAGFQG
ncbi:MAG: lysophospholipid acyltransferase family protein [Paracoccus sp. (in: a-proteobacteria)]|uniref:lysophospholipid acyltransferase family protein n=1 Tax=Paracoccus sp. TaxID=267 RepID=UPI0026DF0B41|nr:lysophospholipid acyltransferase family protein [Paracoccus sp. (in: a-proteobacteria)]MDO5633008.1 lysophospholipid acyltransferase family protein [Paracoccus sp. (in: a-proteobacteria)]